MEKKISTRRSITASDILKIIEDNKASLKSFGVKKLGLFGSYRHGTQKAGSDLDFVVLLDHPTFDSYMELKFYLEDLFHSDVDLVLEETIKPRIRAYILEEVIYAQGL